LETANAYAHTATGTATVNVQSEAADIWTVLDVGTGDTVNVGNSSHTMAGILGDLRIQGALGLEQPLVNLDDSGDPNPRTIDLGGDGVNGYLVNGLLPASSLGRGRLWLNFGTPAPVTLNTGNVASMPTNDVFRVHDFTGAPAITIDAGTGTNTLDYSAFAGEVTVNLARGTATGLAGISNIENVTGGQGNNLLVGDANANVLTGGAGRNILIGGAGLDQLTGGGGDNL